MNQAKQDGSRAVTKEFGLRSSDYKTEAPPIFLVNTVILMHRELNKLASDQNLQLHTLLQNDQGCSL